MGASWLILVRRLFVLPFWHVQWIVDMLWGPEIQLNSRKYINFIMHDNYFRYTFNKRLRRKLWGFYVVTLVMARRVCSRSLALCIWVEQNIWIIGKEKTDEGREDKRIRERESVGWLKCVHSSITWQVAWYQRANIIWNYLAQSLPPVTQHTTFMHLDWLANNPRKVGHKRRVVVVVFVAVVG